MSTEVFVPFGLDAHGAVLVTSDPEVQAMQHVRSLAATEPGERVMLPRYGIPLKDYLFAPGLSAVTARITNEVTLAMAAWEPGITVLRVIPKPGENNGVASIDVDFTRGVTPNPSLSSQATVLVGGTVVEGTA
jgi:phage baseplate assembly protein W